MPYWTLLESWIVRYPDLSIPKQSLAYCKNRGLSVRKFDIGKHNVNDESYHLATSFEVAEHFAAVGHQPIFKLLCKLSPVIVMSATTRGQVGTDNVNEQPHAYWIGKFESNHHSFDEISSQQFSRHWKISNVASFYYDNVMVFLRG